VEWNTETTSWERFRDMKLDYPLLTAKYIVDNNVVRSQRSDRTLQWAKHTLRDLTWTIRQITRLYDFYINDNDEIRRAPCAQKGGKKKKHNYSVPVFKYGVEVPRSVRHALELDKKNGNTFWADAIKLEVGNLIDVECFEFKDPDYKVDGQYQKKTLHVIFDVKHDLRRKARLVAGGHLVEARNIDIYSTTVKPISVKLLNVITDKSKLKRLCGDVHAAYVNAYTNELVYAIAGPEFGELEGSIVLIRKALYGLRSSGERWHAHFADTL
jgi:Reverse transcriptase (RNA-dependent DNA polymerase)